MERSGNGGSEPQTDHKNRPGGDQVYRQGDEGGGDRDGRVRFYPSRASSPRHHADADTRCTQIRQRRSGAARSKSGSKGIPCARENPNDHRSQLLYATEKAEGLRNSKAAIEQTFYEWLLDELSESDRDSFCRVLNDLYLRSKKEARAGFPEVSARLETGAGEDE